MPEQQHAMCYENNDHCYYRDISVDNVCAEVSAWCYTDEDDNKIIEAELACSNIDLVPELEPLCDKFWDEVYEGGDD